MSRNYPTGSASLLLHPLRTLICWSSKITRWVAIAAMIACGQLQDIDFNNICINTREMSNNAIESLGIIYYSGTQRQN